MNKIINKTQAEIDEVISAIQSCNLPTSVQEFAISCINVVIWFPKALPEQKIKLSIIRKWVFGRGAKNNRDPTLIGHFDLQDQKLTYTLGQQALGALQFMLTLLAIMD